MPKQVVSGAMLQCSFGTAPSSLVVLPAKTARVGGLPAANIMDHVPMVNILSFGMCGAIANPAVASATSAALGVLTPMPCVPNTTAPWTPGSPMVKLANMPALNDASTCMCQWAGVISIISPGQTAADIP